MSNWENEYLAYMDERDKKIKTIVAFGGSGGLAQKTLPYLKNYNIKYLSSKECDVRDYAQVEQHMKGSDGCIYFSVVNHDNLIANLNEVEVKHSVDVNVLGFINVLKASANEYKTKGLGRVIYISSILSSNPIRGTSIYAASKSFCETMVKVYAQENAKFGITCNSIQLGYFDAGLVYKVPEPVISNVKQSIPLKRFGDCMELSILIESILKNDYLSGANIKLAGGL